MKTVFNWALTPQPPAVKQYQDIPWLPRTINSKEFEITHLVKNHNNILLSFTTKTKYGTYVLGMHRRLSLPEFRPVGYLANIKAGYRISNVAGYRIPSYLKYILQILRYRTVSTKQNQTFAFPVEESFFPLFIKTLLHT